MMDVVIRSKKSGDYWRILACSNDMNWFLIGKSPTMDEVTGKLKSIPLKKLEAEFEYVRSNGV